MSIPFEKARKTFLGFLQARGKSLNTVKNYRCDLEALGAFCRRHNLDYQALGLADLHSFHDFLKSEGLKPNSRRRKLITAKFFLRYMSGRADVATEGSEKLVPPERVEKAPRLVSPSLVQEIASAQPLTAIGWRNRALIQVLLETGVLVTEALDLKRSSVEYLPGRRGSENPTGARIQVLGKRARQVRVSASTAIALKHLDGWLEDAKYFFYGYPGGAASERNPERMTARGVEVLFKGWAKKVKQPNLRPRTLRHLFVIGWMEKGKSQKEIMDYMGLRTSYAFRVYDALFETVLKNARHDTKKSKLSSETTRTSTV